jgi:hypothetical protein
MAVPMTVRRDGYWDGRYARPGETIAVDDELVETLERAGFAERQAVAPAAAAPFVKGRQLKGSSHGR